ncbi:MAG: hypothetical protein EAZ92_01570 [Candidatus Kapaibacterium sp.]|nr:MAG: hypothetical protein EAZ92_01570 [Candidatus Kapabacteria bacterium]
MTHFSKISTLLLLASLTIAEAQPPQTRATLDKERAKIQAQKIDSIVVWEYALKGNKPEKKGRMDMLIRYDKNGNKTLEGRYNKAEIDTKQEFVYNDKNYLAEQTSFMQYNTPGFTWKYQYDDKGRPTEAVYSSQMSNANQRQTFKYREGLFTANDGVLLEVKFYITKDKVGYRDVYSYDDKAICVKSLRYRIDDSIEKKEEYKYDASGRLTEIAVFGGMEFDEKAAKLVSKKVFTYDDKGNLMSEVETNVKSQLTSQLVHTYDADGRITESTVSSGKKPPVKPVTVRKYVYALFP